MATKALPPKSRNAEVGRKVKNSPELTPTPQEPEPNGECACLAAARLGHASLAVAQVR